MSQLKKPVGAVGKTIKPKPSTPKAKCCANCANVLRFDADKAKLHCGLSYFSAPPLERVIRRREAYPVVQADGVCEGFRVC